MTNPGTAKSDLQKTVPEYIVVEGPMGVGKSSLASRLAKYFDADILHVFLADLYFLLPLRHEARAALSAAAMVGRFTLSPQTYN